MKKPIAISRFIIQLTLVSCVITWIIAALVSFGSSWANLNFMDSLEGESITVGLILAIVFATVTNAMAKRYELPTTRFGISILVGIGIFSLTVLLPLIAGFAGGNLFEFFTAEMILGGVLPAFFWGVIVFITLQRSKPDDVISN